MKNNILCCDWGTSSFRLRLVNRTNYKVLAEVNTAEGVAGTFTSWQKDKNVNRFDFYAQKLLSAIDGLAKSAKINLENVPVIVSGMASSSIGIEEIPYAPLPFATDGSQAPVRLFKNLLGSGTSLILVSGIKSDDDVMRGEETQLIGFFNLSETLQVKSDETIFVFPGTHSKHILVKNGSIIGFQTFMTGEIFNILADHSILKDSIILNSDPGFKELSNRSAYRTGVEKSGSSNLLNTLFSVRTNQLFSKFTKEQNAFYLSGLLIGYELRQIHNNPLRQVVICSGKHLYKHYKLAAEVLNLRENISFIKPDLIDKATIAGQVQIFKTFNAFSYE
jgi:2-dehydro-3-deoxygalactonokinase